MLSNALYFVMASLQFNAICLEVILWASIFASLPMLAMSSIHCVYSVGFVRRDGIIMLLIVCKAMMSGWLWKCVCEFWHAAHIALRMLWCIFSWCFHNFYVFWEEIHLGFLFYWVVGGEVRYANLLDAFIK